eukprot:Polyplicarium_translucidae@DN1748_c0_g1_i1.p2
MESEDGPVPRDLHVATVWEGGMYVFGGWHWGFALDDMWRLDLHTREWSKVTWTADEHVVPRYRHAACPLPSDKWLIHGGRDHNLRVMADALLFDFNRRHFRVAWSDTEMDRQRRCSHVAVAVTAPPLRCSPTSEQLSQDAVHAWFFGGTSCDQSVCGEAIVARFDDFAHLPRGGSSVDSWPMKSVAAFLRRYAHPILIVVLDFIAHRSP